MPDLHDLDHLDDAFEDLARTVGAHTRPLGAERVAGAARRRRTTKVAGGVAALALLTAGGLALLPHDNDERIVEPAGLPAPARLSTDVLDGVTSGWISGWTEPTSIDDVPSNVDAAGDGCMNELLGHEQDDAVASYGASVFLSGHSMAFSRGMVMKREQAAQQLMANPPVSSACTDVRVTSPAPDTELLTARAADANGHAVFAVARWQDRLAFIGVSDPAQADPSTVQVALGDALLAAIQEDSTVSVMSGIGDSAFAVDGGSSSVGSSQSTGSAGPPAYSMTGPTGDQLQQAFGAWAPGYDPSRGSARSMFPPPCVQDDSAMSSSGESVGSAAFVDLTTYASAEDARAGLSFAAKALTGCGFQVSGSWTVGPVTATRGGDKPLTMWFVKDGTHVASVLVQGWSGPPQAVTDAVDQLLVTAIATAKAYPRSTTPPPPEASASGAASSTIS